MLSRTLFSSSRAVASRIGYNSLPRTYIRPFSQTSLLSQVKKYSEAHEWISLDEATSIATMGITDYAQNSLGDVVFIELPAEGSDVAQGDQIGSVESVKAASDIYAPLSGSIQEINSVLSSKPTLLNKSPEQDGWLCKIKVSEKSELDGLMDEAAYKKHCEGEEH